MAKTILVMGESGSGKTTSMRNLNPNETYYIDCDKKGLSWKGWRSQYSAENKNYMKTDLPQTVQLIFDKVDKEKPGIKNIVVDTLNGLMIADEMRRMKEKGFDKWQDLAACVYHLIEQANTLRDDLSVIFLIHTQTERDDNGAVFTRAKTSGRKLDKIVLESKFPTVLLSMCKDGEYIFETKANNSTAKVPMGAIEDMEIENDIAIVLKALEEY